MHSYVDPYEHPFIIEREDGTEIAEADDPVAAKDAARHLMGNSNVPESVEEEGPLVIRARHSGATQRAIRNPFGGVMIQGSQGSLGIAEGWREEEGR